MTQDAAMQTQQHLSRRGELYLSLAEPAWYVIATDAAAVRRGAETTAAAERRIRDAVAALPGTIEAWLPECRIVRSTRSKTIVTDGPLFPGYLIAHLCLDAALWDAIERQRGVARLLRAAGSDAAAALPNEAIGELRRLIAECGNRVLIDERDWHLRPGQRHAVVRGYGAPPVAAQFAPGDSVRVTDGPLADFVGQVKQTLKNGDMQILLDILGRSSVVSLCEAQVAPADAAGQAACV